MTAKGAGAKVWVVMWVGAGDPPAAQISVEGMETVLQAGGRKVRYDTVADRVRAE